MKPILGIALIIIGIFAGLYFGVWWAFIGGIVQIITQVRAPELNALHIAFGILRILSASVIGGLCFLVFALTGIYLIK